MLNVQVVFVLKDKSQYNNIYDASIECNIYPIFFYDFEIFQKSLKDINPTFCVIEETFFENSLNTISHPQLITGKIPIALLTENILNPHFKLSNSLGHIEKFHNYKHSILLLKNNYQTLQNSNQQLKDLKEELNQLLIAKEIIEEKLNQQNLKVSKIEFNKSEVEAELKTLKRIIKEQSEKFKLENQKNKEVQIDLNNLVAIQQDSFIKNNNKLQMRILKSKVSFDKLEKKLKTLRRIHTASKEKYSNAILNSDYKRLIFKFEAKKQLEIALNLQNQVSQLNESIKLLQNNIDELTVNKSELENNISTKSHELDSTISKLEKTELEVTYLENQLKRTNNENSELKQTIEQETEQSNFRKQIITFSENIKKDLEFTKSFEKSLIVNLEKWTDVDYFTYATLSSDKSQLCSKKISTNKYHLWPTFTLKKKAEDGIDTFSQNISTQVIESKYQDDIHKVNIFSFQKNPDLLVYFKLNKQIQKPDLQFLELNLNNIYKTFIGSQINTNTHVVKDFFTCWEFLDAIQFAQVESENNQSFLININFNNLLSQIKEQEQDICSLSDLFKDMASVINQSLKAKIEYSQFDLNNLSILVHNPENSQWLKLVKKIIYNFSYYNYFEHINFKTPEAITPKVDLIPLYTEEYLKFIKQLNNPINENPADSNSHANEEKAKIKHNSHSLP